MERWHRFLHVGVVIAGIVVGILSGSLPALGAVEIVSDTRWTVTQSPYVLQSDLIVRPGATLTIEPGVEVRFGKINTDEGNSNRAELIVEGKMLAAGTIDHPIRFTADSVLEEMGDWAGILLSGSGSRFEYVQVDRALTGITITQTAEIKWSRIEKNLETGILIRETGSPTLIGNELTYNRVGLFVSGSGIVRDNRFQSNSYGLLGTGAGNLTMTGNSLESNTYGIYLEAGEPGNVIEENLIVSNDYGIYIEGGIPPRVNYNDLYNNRMYDFYHLAVTDVDARYNWWGTTETGLIDAFVYDQHDNTSPVVYGYVDYSGFLRASALAPTILNLTVTPPALRSGMLTGIVTFSKEMAVQVKPQITYGLYEPYTAYTVAAAGGQWLSLTEYRFTCTVGEFIPEGVYRFRVAGAQSVDEQALKANIAYTFLVDRTPPQIYTGAELFVFSPNGDGRADWLEAEVYFDEPALLTYGIYQGETAIWGPVTEEDYEQEMRIRWDGRNASGAVLAEGEYELRMTVRDQAGNQNALPVTVPVLLDVTPPELAVDPVSGIQTAAVVLTGQVSDLSNPRTYLWYRAEGEVDWIQIGQVEGSRTGILATWEPSGLLDGLYDLRVEAVDLAGNSVEVFLAVEIDVNAPAVALTLPVAEAHLAGEACFAGRVADYHLSAWTLELEVGGSWVELAAGATAYEGELAFLDISDYLDGEYRVRLMATDQVGRTGQVEQRLYVDNATPPEVKASNVGPAYVSPDGDGFADRLRFLLTFSEMVRWEIEIVFSNTGEQVYTLSGEGSLVESYWDGARTDGSYAGDGLYAYTLTYADQVGHPGLAMTGQVVLDTVAPVLEVQPVPAVTRTNLLSVAGQAADFAQVLVNGKKVVVDAGTFQTEVALLEGENQVTVVAEDLALNQAVETFIVQCDTTLPVIELDPVKTLTNRPEVLLSGRIVETNLTSASVKVQNELGEKVTVLAVDAEQKFSLTLPLAVGANQLSLEAWDAAENRAESRVTVEYLPSIPEIYLLEPAEPYLAASSARVVLKVLEGSVPFDAASIRVLMDGVWQEHQWVAATKQVVVELSGLTEREYLLTAEAANTRGEAGGGLQVTLTVDLTDPQLTLTSPLPGEVLDGWDGGVTVAGSVEDQNLERLTVTVTPTGGASRVLYTWDLRGETALSGELTVWAVGEWANGGYELEVAVQDLAGRQVQVQRMVEIRNTGMLSGRVRGDLGQITDAVLYVVQGKEIQDEIAFDPLSGEFAGRVAVGRYDLALAPWGYPAVVLPDLLVEVGQALAGLELAFPGEIRWNLVGGKQLVSFPFTQAGTPVGATGKVVTFQGFDGQDYYAVQDWLLLKPGRGYWVNYSETMGLTLDGVPVARQEYRLPLSAGWNLIGSPYNYSYLLDGLRFQLEGRTYTFAAAKEAGKVDAGVWEYQNWYRQSDTLEPWKGYWVYVTGAGEVIFSPDLADLPYRWPAPVLQMLSAEPGVLQATEWQVQIRASLGAEADVENYFGTVRGTRTGFDPGVDLREPPGFAPYVSLYFSETGAERLTAAYQPPVTGTRGERSWQMAVESGVTGWVELTWNLEAEAILGLELTDQETGARVDMFREASYRFYQQSGKVRQFTVTARKGEFAIKRLYNYANPFAATGPGKTGTRIRYLMTNDADVQVTVMDVVGRVVKRFPLMQAGEPGGQEGWNEIYWDGRNGKGEPAANGAYIVKVQAYYGKKSYTQLAKMAIINGR